MELLNTLSSTSRRWQISAKKNSEIIARAASLQAQQLRMVSPIEEALGLAKIYNIYSKKKDWREFGDISLHLLVKYPPDIAYFTLYAFRELQTKLGYDPVPFILKAIEMTTYLNPTVFTTALESLKGDEELDKFIKLLTALLIEPGKRLRYWSESCQSFRFDMRAVFLKALTIT